MTKKKCTKCGKIKRLDQFQQDRRQKDGRISQCKNCKNQYYRARNERTREHRAAWWRGYKQRKNLDLYITGVNRRLREDGFATRITIEQYLAAVERQHGLCAICRQPEKTMYQGRLRRMHIDHCHLTGEIRELLCSHCNTGIGQFFDSPELCRAAAAYLEQHREPK